MLLILMFCGDSMNRVLFFSKPTDNSQNSRNTWLNNPDTKIEVYF